MIETPTTSILDFNGVQHPMPSYSVCLHLDQLIRSWLFATISPDLLTEAHDVLHSKQIWERCSQRFNTASLTRLVDLSRTLSTLSKDPNKA